MINYRQQKIEFEFDRGSGVLATGSTTDLRRNNRDAVLRLLKASDLRTRTEIADRVGLTNAAVSRITKELIDVGLVEEGDRIVHKGQAGRRQVTLRLSEQGAYVVGIAVTLNAREVVIGNGRGNVVARTDCSDIALDDPSAALREFARRTEALLRQSEIDHRRLLGGAASVAGRVDPEDGRIIGADPLDWDGQQVARSLEALLGFPFVSEGRAAALLRLEHSEGGTSGMNDILLLNIGLRMGSALMIDGHLLRGATNNAFVLADFPISGEATLDDVASGFAVLRRLGATGERMPADADPGVYLRQLVDRRELHDAAVSKAFRECGIMLGRAIKLLAPVLSPQRIILAGLVAREGAYLDGVQSQLSGTGLSIEASQFTTAQSAIQLALDYHLFHDGFEPERLVAA